jgi:hypothetical protein
MFEAFPQDIIYLAIAQEAADFALNLWFKPNSVISADIFNGTSCTGLNVFGNDSGSWSTGTIIEGISVLANITQNATLRTVHVRFHCLDCRC